jgi:hypothetical protein
MLLKLFNLFVVVGFAFFLSRLDVYIAKKGIIPSPALLYLLWLSAIYVVYRILDKNNNPHFTRGSLYLVLSFFLIAIIEMFWFMAEGSSSQSALTLFPILLSIVILVLLFSSVELPLEKITLFTLLIICITILIDVVYLGTFSKSFYRPAGSPENPNSAAMMIALCFFIIASFKKIRLKDFLLFSLAFVCILMTSSRSGLLFFILLSMFWFGQLFIKQNSPNKIKYSVYLLAFGFLIFFVISYLYDSSDIFNSSAVRDRLSISGQVNVIESDDSRLTVLISFMGRIPECFLVGCGLAEFSIMELHAHNTVLNYIFKYGFLSIPLLFFPFYIFISRKILTIDSSFDVIKLSIFAAFYAYFIFVNNDLYALKLFVFVVCFLCCGLKDKGSER